ncbi:MAG TPA: NUDIX hydrolase [Clostridiales bacterium]|nr:NUDIX hydrolase [Clostridiales bacterium]
MGLFSIGAYAVIFDAQRRVLLCHRRDMDVWNLPGGRVESGELPNEAAVRETREETGLKVVVERLVGVYGKTSKDELVFAFLCRVVGGELQETDEADACQFFHVDEMPPNISPKQVQRIHDALQRGEPVFRRQTGPDTREMIRRWERGMDAS